MLDRSLLRHEAFPGVLLLLATVLAIVAANSPLSNVYSEVLNIPVVVGVASFVLEKPLQLWINDGLMAVFFFLVGLELKREMVKGHLSEPSQLVLPGIAAVCGILFPALIYYAFNGADPVAARGWAIPAATDIAFAMGIYALVGTRLPLTLKLFLLSVALFDDIGAILIIALFYSEGLSVSAMGIAGLFLTVAFLLNRAGVRAITPYILIFIAVWVCVLKSGVHATLAGFVTALFIPLSAAAQSEHSVLEKLEHDLHPWVGFMVIPVFAFANAGVNLTGLGVEAFLHPVTLGVFLGLLLGKQFGIFLPCYAVIKLGWASLPKGATFGQLWAVSVLCGIGFTMSLFVGTLAFNGFDPAILNNVKIGVLSASLVAALQAALMIHWMTGRRDASAPMLETTDGRGAVL